MTWATLGINGSLKALGLDSLGVAHVASLSLLASSIGCALPNAASTNTDGRATVALSVVDGHSGEAIDPAEYDIALWSMDWSHSEYVKALEPVRATEREALIAVDSRDARLLVRVPGYVAAEARIRGLEPNETRAVAVEVFAGGALTVEIVEAGDVPVPGVEVLVHPSDPNFDPNDPSVGIGSLPEDTAFGSWRFEGVTDERGTVAFEDLPPVHYDVRAALNTRMAREERVETTRGETSRAGLEFAPAGSIDGTVRAGAGLGLSDLRIRAKLKPGRRGRIVHRKRDYGAAPLDADGAFRIEGLAPRSYTIDLDGAGYASVLGEVRIEAGANTRDFDITDHAPGSISVTGMLDGRPASGASVEATLSGTVRSARGMIDEAGSCVIGPLLPGAWYVSMTDVDRSWHVVAPASIDVAPGESAESSFVVHLAHGRLRVLDAATGEPAGEKFVLVDKVVTGKTDADGLLEIELPIGSHGFEGYSRGFPRGMSALDAPPVVVAWRESGPDLESIALEFD